MRVFPSDIVAYINKAFPDAAGRLARREAGPTYAGGAGKLLALVDLVGELAEDMLPTGDSFAKLTAAASEIRARLASWQGRNPRGVDDPVYLVDGYGLDAVALLLDVMQSLPDQAIPEATTGLEFIEDERLRSDLRSDIASVDALLRSCEWKATMVIAGSVMEALLLHALLSIGEDKAKASAAQRNLPCKKREPSEWHLPHYIQVAHDLGIIPETCLDQAKIAGDCRNLIHPGKEYREGKKAERKDAFSAKAGLEHVIAEVTRWWESRETRPVV